MVDVDTVIANVHQQEWARVVATLARRFSDLDVAEDMAAEAFAEAVQKWPLNGVPPQPAAWIMTTAYRKAIDCWRRENKRANKHEQALYISEPQTPLGLVDDDRLRLIFICCHPALAVHTQVALTLRLVGGLSTAEIASAFLVSEGAMSRRITRAKAKLKASRAPLDVPYRQDLPGRVGGVLTVLYLIFNEGYLTSGLGGEVTRGDLTSEAIRLARMVGELVPDSGEGVGLLALMLMTEGRRVARVSADGVLVSLAEQNRDSWDALMIAEGHQLVRSRLLSGEAPGRFQILAAINAVHTCAPSFGDTDWSQIVALYDQLVACDSSPVVMLNRAIAVGELDGPQVALSLIEGLPLGGYHLFHATRAEFFRRLLRRDDALVAYDCAIRLAGNSAEAAYLSQRRGEVVRW